jgi:beta-N-acetylhexosaminidase
MTPAIFGLTGPVLTGEERAFFRDADPAGYILFGRNVIDRAQLRALTDSLRDLHGRDRLLVSIDQEGGRVARMKPPEWDAYPPGDDFARLWQLAPASAIEAARANAEALGHDLAEVGITVDYLPLLDVRQPGANDVIGDRALGTEPMQVAALGRAVLDGLGRAGVRGCIKHMPGHGRGLVDSHKELPTVEAGEAELEIDLEPFRTLADAPIGMTAHIRYSAWDRDNPGTLSAFVIEEIIRRRIGFDGLLLTDDIDMEALAGTVPGRAQRAIAAGCDLVLNCWARMDDMVGMADRLPSITGAAARRLEHALTFPARPPGVEPGAADRRAQLLARRDSLLALARDLA